MWSKLNVSYECMWLCKVMSFHISLVCGELRCTCCECYCTAAWEPRHTVMHYNLQYQTHGWNPPQQLWRQLEGHGSGTLRCQWFKTWLDWWNSLVRHVCCPVKVRIKVVYSGIGPVTASDVALASAADASILAFNVKPAAPAVEAQAKQCAVTTCTQVGGCSQTQEITNPEARLQLRSLSSNVDENITSHTLLPHTLC